MLKTDNHQFLTVPEVAAILRLKRSTAYAYVAQGYIPSIRIGRFIRIPTEALEALGKFSEENN